MSEALIKMVEEQRRQQQQSSNYLDHIKINYYNSNPEYQARLFARARTIDLRQLAHISILKPRHISGRLMAAYCKLVTAQCIDDNISNVVEGLCLRDFNLQRDFEDDNHNHIQHSIWQQPVDHDYDCLNNVVNIYQTNRDVDYDIKIYFFYGIQNLNFNHPSYADQFIFKEMDMRMIDIIELTNRKPGENRIDFAYLQRPILARRGDDMNIQVHVSSDYPLRTGARDNFKLLGIVGEAMGAYMY